MAAARHGNIEQYDIGPVLSGKRHGFIRRLTRCHNIDIILGIERSRDTVAI